MVKIICSAARPTGRRGMEKPAVCQLFLLLLLCSEIEETAEIQSLRGEAYFLRAYWHFYLLNPALGIYLFMDDFWDGNCHSCRFTNSGY